MAQIPYILWSRYRYAPILGRKASGRCPSDYLPRHFKVEAGECGLHVWVEPERAYAEGEQAQYCPADEAQFKAEIAPFVALHKLLTAAERFHYAAVGVFRHDIGRKDVGVGFYDAGDYEKQSPQRNEYARYDPEPQRLAEIVETAEKGGKFGSFALDQADIVNVKPLLHSTAYDEVDKTYADEQYRRCCQHGADYRHHGLCDLKLVHYGIGRDVYGAARAA